MRLTRTKILVCGWFGTKRQRRKMVIDLDNQQRGQLHTAPYFKTALHLLAQCYRAKFARVTQIQRGLYPGFTINQNGTISKMFKPQTAK